MGLDLRDAVRKRPGMYLGDVNSWEAANSVVYELVSNSIDLFLVGKADRIKVIAKDYSIEVCDNGPGFPFFKESIDPVFSSYAEYILLKQHYSATVDGHAPHIHIGDGGIGLAPCNAASKMLLIESSDGCSFWRQRFLEGRRDGDTIVEEGEFAKGTKISVELDQSIFKEPLNVFELRRRLFETAHLYPGVFIEFEEAIFFSSRGLIDLGHFYLRENVVSDYRHFSSRGIKDNVEYHVAALGQAGSGAEFISWANGVVTDGGSHLQGLKNALWDNKWSPQVALIHVVMHDPRYAGPTKQVLKMPEVKDVIEGVMMEEIGAYLMGE